MTSMSIEDLALEAEVDVGYVRRLIELGALEAGREHDVGDVHRVQLLHSWEDAGFAVDDVVDLIHAGEISTSWLAAPVMTAANRLDTRYEQLSEEEDVPLALLQSVQEVLGFAPPGPHDRVVAGDRELVRLIRILQSMGARQTAILAVVRVYADSLRRIAKAEAELYETEIEEPLRRSGRSEQELLDYGGKLSDPVIASLEHTVVDIYRRQREHVWIEHRINHAESALERAGLHRQTQRATSICFVDLAGYTRLVEERGDKVAAELAAELASLVEDVSRRHRGRPIRWLGDGGMFHFKDPGAAVLSGLDMVDGAPLVGLPPVHIGIHTGPVVFQYGDVYGRTVNLAARIASHAEGGQVLVSDETMGRVAETGVRFEPLGPVSFKGVPNPVTVHQAVRARG